MRPTPAVGLDVVATPAAATPHTTPIPRVVPRVGDPRLPFAAILTLYAVLGFTVLGFSRTPWQMLAVVASGCVLDVVLARLLTRRWVAPLSAYISCVSLALLLNFAHGSWLLFVPVYLTIASKYVLTYEGRHVFNPSMFGVATSLLLTRELVTAAPAYQWAGSTIGMSAFLIMAALVLFVFRIGKTPLIVSFVLLYALQTALRAWILRFHMPPEMLFLGTLSAPPFFLFTFYMITDPATSPKSVRGQVGLALALTVVDLWLHTRESVFTFFYAALICAGARFVFLHTRRLWRERANLGVRLAPSGSALVRIVGVGGLGVLLVGAARLPAGTAANRVDVPFRMEAMAASYTGIHTAMSDVLDRIDPRVAHVGKWLLSVGDAVAVGDWDGDGRMDLFLTNTMKRPEDRGALYRNRGDFRFERMPFPAMDAVLAGFPDTGLPSAGAFVDVDGDGDEDLAVAFGYGRSRLFVNRLAETGRPEFANASDRAGLDEHTISLAIDFLDYDRDGTLDMLVTNAMPPYLEGYDRPTPLNVFRLPAPQHDGDRRMFRFMHDGWHDADNGGRNVFHRGLGGGRFETIDPAAIGMPETHWSISSASGDLNRDGWTDVYVANDFGPDDLYLNDHGRRFVRVHGPLFGDVGRDTYKGMNSTLADVDGNGWLDVYVSNNHHALQAEGSMLWMFERSNDPFVPRIRDQATLRGALNENRWGWGAAAGDLDLDGWLDLVQANGMVDDRLDHRYEGRKDYWYVNHKLMQAGPEMHTYADMWGDLRGRVIFPNEPRRAYLNRGGQAPGTFVDVAARIGIADPDDSRGVAMADFDDDGDLDLVITNQHGPVSIYRNTLRGPGAHGPHFLGVRLIGGEERTSRAALGTRVEARWREGGREVVQVREVTALTGFSGQNDPRLLFGLGSHAGPVSLTVDWYGGGREHFTLEPDRYHLVRQGAPRVAVQEGAR